MGNLTPRLQMTVYRKLWFVQGPRGSGSLMAPLAADKELHTQPDLNSFPGFVFYTSLPSGRATFTTCFINIVKTVTHYNVILQRYYHWLHEGRKFQTDEKGNLKM